MNHFDEITCMQYLEGVLERGQAREVSAHADSCASCKALMRAIERESRMLMAAMREEEEAVPARLLSPVIRERTPWAWILSFGMAAAGIYWLWSGVIDPWQEQLSRAGFGEADLMTLVLFRGSPWTWLQSVWTFMQVIAAMSIGGIALILLRRGFRKRATQAMAMVMGALGLGLGLSPAASAIEFHHSQASYTLPAGSVVKGDLIVAGANIRIDGEVQGDLIVGGSNCTVSGHVLGDVLMGGTSLRITGPVDGNVRASLSVFELLGKVAKNVMVFGGNIELDSGSEIGEDLMTFVGQASIGGKIARDIYMRGGRLSLGSFVGGNVEVHAQDAFVVDSGADLRGPVKYYGTHQAQVDPGAKLASPLQFTYVTRQPQYTSGRFYWHRSLIWAASFLFGLVLILLMPGLFAEAVRRLEQFSSVGFGALLVIATPILAVLICISLVAIPIGIAAFLLWIIAVYAAKTFVCTWLGQRLMGQTSTTGGLIGRFAIGLLLYEVASQVPYLGFWVRILVAIWGIGAFAVALYERRRPATVLAAA